MAQSVPRRRWTAQQAVAFTDEESARRGESEQMPEDMREQWESTTHDVQFLDMHKPWFATAR